MKFIHLSDLHLGKRVNEYSMLEDQQYILTKIINIIDEEAPEAVILAGDIYDKPVPPAEAVELFDDFLYSLAVRKLQVFVISGNHDSPERLAFGNRLIDASGIHLSPVYNGEVRPIPLQDEYGTVEVYMLPFIKPVHVRRFYPDEEITRKLEETAEKMGRKIYKGIVHSGDAFYYDPAVKKEPPYPCIAGEMESFALFANARFLHKKAACLLSISDKKDAAASPEERQTAFKEMIQIALDTAVTL